MQHNRNIFRELLGDPWLSGRLTDEMQALLKGQAWLLERKGNVNAHAFLLQALHYKETALLDYALNGASLHTGFYFAAAALHYLLLLEQAEVLEMPMEFIGDGRQMAWDVDPVKHPELFKQDRSIFNSRQSLEMMACALLGSRPQEAGQIAAMGEESQEEIYLLQPSSISTMAEHHLFYAVKAFYRSDSVAIRQHLDSIQQNDTITAMAAQSLYALLEKDRIHFLSALEGQLQLQEQLFTEEQRDIPYFICSAAVITAALALQEGLVTKDSLPQHNNFFPLQLLAAAG